MWVRLLLVSLTWLIHLGQRIPRPASMAWLLVWTKGRSLDVGSLRLRHYFEHLLRGTRGAFIMVLVQVPSLTVNKGQSAVLGCLGPRQNLDITGRRSTEFWHIHVPYSRINPGELVELRLITINILDRDLGMEWISVDIEIIPGQDPVPSMTAIHLAPMITRCWKRTLAKLDSSRFMSESLEVCQLSYSPERLVTKAEPVKRAAS